MLNNIVNKVKNNPGVSTLLGIWVILCIILIIIITTKKETPNNTGNNNTGNNNTGNNNTVYVTIDASNKNSYTPGTQLLPGFKFTVTNIGILENPSHKLLITGNGTLELVELNPWSTVSTIHSSASNFGSLVMEHSGNLVIFNSNNQVLWSTNTSGNSNAYLELTNNGSLVIKKVNGDIVSYVYRSNIQTRDEILNVGTVVTIPTQLTKGVKFSTTGGAVPILKYNLNSTTLRYLWLNTDGNLHITTSLSEPLTTSNKKTSITDTARYWTFRFEDNGYVSIHKNGYVYTWGTNQGYSNAMYLTLNNVGLSVTTSNNTEIRSISL